MSIEVELNIITNFALSQTKAINGKSRHIKPQNSSVNIRNTGKWLAEQVGKNEATVSRWCSNKMQMLVRIAELLNVDPRQLINGGNKD